MTRLSPTRARRAPLWCRWVARGIARWYLRKPELEEVIASRYRSPRALGLGVLNELGYRLGWRRAPGLLSVNLELTNHCNLKCTFCPTGNSLLMRPRGHMRAEVLRRALAGAGRLEFALLFQWGEPLLHPQFAKFARAVRARGVRTLVTTNGTLLDDRRVGDLLDADIDRVTISVDGDAATHAEIRGVPLARTEDGLNRLLAERDRRNSPTAVDVSMVISPETEHAADAFRERFAPRVDRVQQIPLLTEGVRRTRCREPWRGGLVVLQDGTVTVCCVDHDGDLAIGHVERDDLRSLWNGPGMRRLREQHCSGDLPARCANCTEYPTDAAAPRFSRPEEASRIAPHQQRQAASSVGAARKRAEHLVRARRSEAPRTEARLRERAEGRS